MRSTANTSNGHAGFTLVEVLVAMFVLAVGLLGMALLQTTGLRLNTNSYTRSQATFLAYDIIDRMRANRLGFQSGFYTVGYSTAWASYISCRTTTCKCENSAAASDSCSASQLALYDLGHWYERQYDPTGAVTSLLPGAREAYTDAAPRVATISISNPIANPNLVTVTMVWKEQNQSGIWEDKAQSWMAEITQW